MINRWPIVATLLISVLALPSMSAAEFDLDGCYKSFTAAYDLPDNSLSRFTGDTSPFWQMTNRLRLQGLLPLGRIATLTVAYDIKPVVQDSRLWNDELSIGTLDRSSYRAYDFDRRIYPDEDESSSSYGLLHNLDRAVLSMDAGGFDLYVGRQAVAWGSGRAVNPTDVIAPYGYTELDTEDRVGVDGVRVRVPLGFMGEIDGGYLFGDECEYEKSAMFLRGKAYLGRTDAALLLVGFQENLMLGLDLARSLGGAGIWLEAGYVFDDALANSRRCACRDYGRVTLGADYSLTSTLYAFVEYHYSEAGSNDAEDYTDLLTSPAFTEGSVFLLGRHYLIPGALWQITPLLAGSGEMLLNIGDPSLLLAPRLEYSLDEDVYLAVGAFVGFGRKAGVEFGYPLTVPELHLRSEFGTYPDVFYTSFSVYF